MLYIIHPFHYLNSTQLIKFGGDPFKDGGDNLIIFETCPNRKVYISYVKPPKVFWILWVFGRGWGCR